MFLDGGFYDLSWLVPVRFPSDHELMVQIGLLYVFDDLCAAYSLSGKILYRDSIYRCFTRSALTTSLMARKSFLMYPSSTLSSLIIWFYGPLSKKQHKTQNVCSFNSFIFAKFLTLLYILYVILKKNGA